MKYEKMNRINPRVWLTSSDGLIQYVSLTKHKLEEAVEVVRKSFFMGEKVSVAVGLSKNPEAIREFDDLIIFTAMDGISVIAEDKVTGRIIGCALNKINIKNSFSDGLFENYKVQHLSGQAFLEVNAELDRKVNAFDLLKTNCYVEHMVIGVLPEFRKKGIAEQLQESSNKIMKCLINGENAKVSLGDKALSLDPIPTAGLGNITHTAAKRIASTVGYRIVAEIDFTKSVFTNKLLTASVLSKISPMVIVTHDYKKC